MISYTFSYTWWCVHMCEWCTQQGNEGTLWEPRVGSGSHGIDIISLSIRTPCARFSECVCVNVCVCAGPRIISTTTWPKFARFVFGERTRPASGVSGSLRAYDQIAHRHAEDVRLPHAFSSSKDAMHMKDSLVAHASTMHSRVHVCMDVWMC